MGCAFWTSCYCEGAYGREEESIYYFIMPSWNTIPFSDEARFCQDRVPTFIYNRPRETLFHVKRGKKQEKKQIPIPNQKSEKKEKKSKSKTDAIGSFPKKTKPENGKFLKADFVEFCTCPDLPGECYRRKS